jgi:hypothetical protein
MSTMTLSRVRLVAVLQAAEAELRGHIDSALSAQQYDEIAVYAQVASELVALRLRFSEPEELPATRASSASVELLDTEGSTRLPENATPARKLARGYPRFEREGERLIKIGWSKKDEKEYEHKTSHSAIEAVVKSLRETKGRFTIDEILPIKDATESEVPSYQVYIVVAWLRQTGAIDRIGNDGYTTRQAALALEAVNTLWNSLPTR